MPEQLRRRGALPPGPGHHRRQHRSTEERQTPTRRAADERSGTCVRRGHRHRRRSDDDVIRRTASSTTTRSSASRIAPSVGLDGSPRQPDRQPGHREHGRADRAWPTSASCSATPPIATASPATSSRRRRRRTSSRSCPARARAPATRHRRGRHRAVPRHLEQPGGRDYKEHAGPAETAQHAERVERAGAARGRAAGRRPRLDHRSRRRRVRFERGPGSTANIELGGERDAGVVRRSSKLGADAGRPQPPLDPAVASAALALRRRRGRSRVMMSPSIPSTSHTCVTRRDTVASTVRCGRAGRSPTPTARGWPASAGRSRP